MAAQPNHTDVLSNNFSLDSSGVQQTSVHSSSTTLCLALGSADEFLATADLGGGSTAPRMTLPEVATDLRDPLRPLLSSSGAHYTAQQAVRTVERTARGRECGIMGPLLILTGRQGASCTHSFDMNP